MAHTVSAAQVRQHLLQLQSEGFPIGQIARRASMPVGVLVEIATGTRKEILAYAAQRVLAVKPVRHSPGEMLSARGAQRRVQSLHAVGWSARAIAENAQWSTDQLVTLMRASSISRFRHDQISAVFSRLWDKQPDDLVDAEAARQLAIENSWAAPLAWDDIDADDSPAVPTAADGFSAKSVIDPTLVDEPLTHEEILIEDQRLRARNVSSVQIAQQLGIGRATLYRIRAAAAAAAEAAASTAVDSATSTAAESSPQSTAAAIPAPAPAPAEAPAAPSSVSGPAKNAALGAGAAAESGSNESGGEGSDCVPDRSARVVRRSRPRCAPGNRWSVHQRRARARPRHHARSSPASIRTRASSLMTSGMSPPHGIVIHSPPQRFDPTKELSSP